MRFLKFLLASALVLVAVFVVGAFLLPAQTHVERSIVIERAPADVFAVLDGFERFSTWSPWSEYDPAMRMELSGPARGVGARMAWAGNAQVGSGSQQITDSVPTTRIVIALSFDGFDPAVATYTLAPDGQGTRVTWSYDAALGINPVQRWLGLAMDSMLGPDYEKGLRRLKAMLEDPSPAAD